MLLLYNWVLKYLCKHRSKLKIEIDICLNNRNKEPVSNYFYLYMKPSSTIGSPVTVCNKSIWKIKIKSESLEKWLSTMCVHTVLILVCKHDKCAAGTCTKQALLYQDHELFINNITNITLSHNYALNINWHVWHIFCNLILIIKLL